MIECENIELFRRNKLKLTIQMMKVKANNSNIRTDIQREKEKIYISDIKMIQYPSGGSFSLWMPSENQ